MKVYFVSDGTAITAEVFGSAMLSFFDVDILTKSVPFLSTKDQANGLKQQIDLEVEQGHRYWFFIPFQTKLSVT